MALITAEQIKSAREFFEQACQKHSCIFAAGYFGLSELPICSRRRSGSPDGREILLPASERGYCKVGAIVETEEIVKIQENEKVGNRRKLFDPVTISPDGVKKGSLGQIKS